MMQIGGQEVRFDGYSLARWIGAMLTLAAAVGFATPLPAQMGIFSFEGLFRRFNYRPFGHFDDASVFDAGVLPEQPSDLSAVAWGATGHIVARNRLGVAAQLAANYQQPCSGV
jgi:hypothetical protein